VEIEEYIICIIYLGGGMLKIFKCILFCTALLADKTLHMTSTAVVIANVVLTRFICFISLLFQVQRSMTHFCLWQAQSQFI